MRVKPSSFLLHDVWFLPPRSGCYLTWIGSRTVRQAPGCALCSSAVRLKHFSPART